MQNKYIKNKKGIALVEVVAALGVAVVVLTALVSLSIFTMRNSLRSKLLLEGTKHASKQIELLRAYRDDTAISWDTYINDLTTVNNCETNYCYVDYVAPDLVIQSGSRPNGAGLEVVNTYFTVTNITVDSVDVTATAEWLIGGETKSTNIYTTLTNWRGK